METTCTSAIRRKQPEIIVFNNPRKRKASVIDVENKEQSTSTNTLNSEVNFKKARNDVMKLGMSNLDKEKYQDAKVAFAVSLGAKPPKRKYVNYKDLQQEIKERKKENEDQKYQMSLLSTKNSGKNKFRSVVRHLYAGPILEEHERLPKEHHPEHMALFGGLWKKDKNAVKGFDYQVGHYKNGVQVIPKELVNSKKSSFKRRK